MYLYKKRNNKHYIKTQQNRIIQDKLESLPNNTFKNSKTTQNKTTNKNTYKAKKQNYLNKATNKYIENNKKTIIPPKHSNYKKKTKT